MCQHCHSDEPPVKILEIKRPDQNNAAEIEATFNAWMNCPVRQARQRARTSITPATIQQAVKEFNETLPPGVEPVRIHPNADIGLSALHHIFEAAKNGSLEGEDSQFVEITIRKDLPNPSTITKPDPQSRHD